VLHYPGQERRRLLPCQAGVQGPVFLRGEGLDGPFPVAHQPQGHGLHPPGGEAGLDLLPEDGTDLVAHQAVQDPPGLLGFVAGPVQRHRMGQGLPDGRLGQLQEQDPLKMMVLFPQGLGDMPGNGLPFPVRVGTQEDLGDAGSRLLQLLDDLGLAEDGGIFGRKILVQVHPQVMGRQILDVALAGDDHKIGPQVFLQCLGLGWGFDD